MSWLKTLSEKIGITEEEYDDEEELTSFPTRGEGDTVPPEFLQHKQKPVYKPELRIDPVRETESQFVPVEKPTEKPAPKKSFFGSKKKAPELNTVEALAEALHMVVLQPKTFDSSQEIADHLLHGQPVIVNYEETDVILAQRISDFVCGCTFALGGTVKNIGTKIQLCAPQRVDIESKDDVIAEMSENFDE